MLEKRGDLEEVSGKCGAAKPRKNSALMILRDSAGTYRL